MLVGSLLRESVKLFSVVILGWCNYGQLSYALSKFPQKACISLTMMEVGEWGELRNWRNRFAVSGLLQVATEFVRWYPPKGPMRA